MSEQPLDTYFKRYASNPDDSVPGGEAMHHESLRLITFKEWPDESKSWPSTLAHAGQYYEGNADETRCFSCKGTVRHGENSDDPNDEHARSTRHCPLLIGREPRNIPFDPPGDRSQTISQTVRPAMEPDPVNQPSASSTAGSSSLTLTLSTELIQNEMKREKVRLLTFSGWPSDSPVQPESLAKAGLYFLNSLDRVKCAFCQNVLRNWEEGDVPETEHKKHFPDCPFVLGLDVGNIRKETDDEPIDPAVASFVQEQPAQMTYRPERSRHPEYVTEFNRLNSYGNFPRHSPVKPDVLAHAGFFYTGTSDSVQCFYCDVALRNWMAGDDPWEEHARWYPRCDFLQAKKGERFIHQIQRKYGRTATQTTTPVTPGQSRRTVTSTAGGTTTSVTQSNWIQMQMSSSQVQTVLEMGYNRGLVRRALEWRQAVHGSEDTLTIQDILETIFEVEESGDYEQQEEAETSAAPAPAPAQSATTTTAAVVRQTPTASTAATGSAATRETAEMTGRSLLEENRELREQKICKICMDRDAEMVFIPCGHLVCCINCAPAMSKCPICRQTIRGTVRVYLS